MSKNLREIEIDEIGKLDLSDDLKNVLLEMNDLYFDYSNFNPDNGSHAFRVAEGIKLSMDCIKKHFTNE